MTTIDYGNVDSDEVREPTTGNEVFVANHRTVANITHVYVDDGGVFGSNLVGSVLPQSLFPAVPVLNDALYIGTDSTLDDSGPFWSAIFDIGTAAVFTGTAALTWSYWDGGAWSVLAPSSADFTDGTAATIAGNSFLRTGVNGIYIDNAPNGGDWATRAINGVTGYWIRANFDPGTGGMTTVPTQQNRNIYSVVWPYIEIQSTEIAGDIKALLNLKFHAKITEFTAGHFVTGRIIAGIRGVDRGSAFTPVLNFADSQNPSGVTVTDDTNATFTADNKAAAGESIRATVSGTVLRSTITLDSSIANHYQGRFRAIGRYNSDSLGGGGAIVSYLTCTTGSGGAVITTPTISTPVFAAAAYGTTIDYGIININRTGFSIDEIVFSFYSSCPSSYDMLDFWLIPVDEWTTEIEEPATSSAAKYLRGDVKLEIDGITYPRESVWIASENGLFQGNYINLSAAQPAITAARRIKMYFFASTRYDSTNDRYASNMVLCMSVTLETTQRYLSLRGSG